jgi:hypothetical protein
MGSRSKGPKAYYVFFFFFFFFKYAALKPTVSVELLYRPRLRRSRITARVQAGASCVVVVRPYSLACVQKI